MAKDIDIFGKVPGLDEAFEPLAKEVGINRRLTSGAISREILEDALGKPVPTPSSHKKHKHKHGHTNHTSFF